MNTPATPAPAPKPLPAALIVSFDIGQAGNRLMWSSVEGGSSNYLRHGPDAGMLHFDLGDQFGIGVLAYAQPSAAPAPLKTPPFNGFKVLGLALITVPLPGAGACPPVSPFADATSAVTEATSISSFSAAKSPTLNRADPKHPYWETYSGTVAPLPVKAGNLRLARWEISLVLTVWIDYAPPRAPETRVFVLDPEAQVGNGTRGD